MIDDTWKKKGHIHTGKDNTPVICPICKGTGYVDNYVCPKCEGEGVVYD